MPRTHGRIQAAIWSDADFIAMRANPDAGHDVETWEWCIEQNTGASFAGDA